MRKQAAGTARRNRVGETCSGRASASSSAGKVAALLRALLNPLSRIPMLSALSSAVPAALTRQLQRLVGLCLAVVLCFGLAACDGSRGSLAPSLSPEAVASIERQAEGFLAARNRLPELAALVNERNWVFTRNLIHGPMQEVGRQMLYINRLLLPADRPEANQLADQLKTAMAQLDEAARLQDGDKLSKAYIAVASGFGRYAQILPAQVQLDLKQA
jgi:photosystem II protein PsbQ